MTEDLHLRVTADGETSNSESVEAASRSGSRIDVLKAMRLVLARAFDAPETSATALAAITIRVADLTTEIESLIAREQERLKGESDGAGAGGSTNGGSTGRKWRPEAI